MSPIRAEDLPPRLRERLEAQEGPVRGRQRQRAEGGGRTPVRCHECPEVVVLWGTGTPVAATRHEEATGHHRWDVVM